MSFKCYFCTKTSKKGEKCRMVPVQMRDKAYPEGTVGLEIAREGRCCESCWLAGAAAPVEHLGKVQPVDN